MMPAEEAKRFYLRLSASCRQGGCSLRRVFSESRTAPILLALDRQMLPPPIGPAVRAIHRVSGIPSSRKLRRHRKRVGAARPRPWLLALLCYSLRTFLDLRYLVGHEPVSLPVDGFRRFFVWGFGKAEDLAAFLVVPVPVILDPVFVLGFKILLVGLGHRLCGQPFHPLVVVHK